MPGDTVCLLTVDVVNRQHGRRSSLMLVWCWRSRAADMLLMNMVRSAQLEVETHVWFALLPKRDLCVLCFCERWAVLHQHRPSCLTNRHFGMIPRWALIKPCTEGTRHYEMAQRVEFNSLLFFAAVERSVCTGFGLGSKIEVCFSAEISCFSRKS